MSADLSIIIRVEKLLAKAADPGCTEPEREAFQAKAFQLMQEHRISEAQLGGHLDADDVLGTYPLGDFNGIYGRVRLQMVNSVASAFDVQIFWRGYGNKRSLYGYGFKSDADRVVTLTNRLLADADVRAKGLTVHQDDVTMLNPDDGSYYRSEKGALQAAVVRERRGFYLGYADAVRSRLRTATAAATSAHAEEVGAAASQSAALVLVDRKRQVNEGFRAAHPNLSTAGGLNSAGGSGHSAGYSAGSRADLSSQNTLRSQKALGR